MTLSPKRSPLLVVSQKCGQLGNRLILGSHLIALSCEFGWRLAYPAFEEYAEFFRGPVRFRNGFAADEDLSRTAWPATDFRLCNLAARILRKLKMGNRLVNVLDIPGDDPSCNVDLAEAAFRQRIESARATLLLGWRVRNYPLVKKHNEVIRKYFQPIDAVEQVVNHLLADARKSGRAVVGVHIRQGDYRTFLGGKHFHETAKYVAYMRRISELLRDPLFIVCSNEKQPTGIFGDLETRPGPGSIVGDLHALSRCDFILGAPSTFCRWAAFHGQRRLHLIEEVEPDRLTLDDFVQQGEQI